MKKRIIIMAIALAGLSSCVGHIKGDKHIITKRFTGGSGNDAPYRYIYELDNSDAFYTDSLYAVGDVLTIKK